MEDDKRNLVMFFVISMLIMVGSQYLFHDAGSNHKAEQMINQKNEAIISAIVPEKKSAPVQKAKIENIKINSRSLSGIISSRGARIDSVYLKKYKKDLDKKECVSILSSHEREYFAQSGWISDNQNTIVPDEASCWKANSLNLSENSPVVLTWDNGSGLLFEKRISIDENFLITITEKVKNYGVNPVSLKPVTIINRESSESADSSMNFYEGPLGYINGKLEEIKYEDISKQHEIKHQTKTGWFGMTDKYWLVAFIPNQSLNHNVVYKHLKLNDSRNFYKIESTDEAILISPSVEVSKTHYLFIGAKEISTLDMYEEKLKVQHLDLAIDFGYLYILTKPLLYAISYTKNFVGNMGLGIILITLLIKLLLFPLANKSYRSMNRMSLVQPKIQELRKKHEGDNARFGQAVSEMYKKEKINPVGGCLPVLLQSPILFALYKVLYISIEMRQASFLWWIRDLSLPDPLSIVNLFGLIPANLPEFLQIGVWPLLMGISMWLQQKLTPAPPDPTQAKMMLIMPIMLTFMFAQLPSGLVIYWTFSNIFGIIQQYAIKKLDNNKTIARHSAG